MNVELFDDPAVFADAAMPLLLRNEAENCFWIGMMSTPGDLDDALKCVVRSVEGEPVAVAIRTPGRQLVITRASEAVAQHLARSLYERRVGLPGVGGVRETAEAFAREWVGLTGATPRVQVVLRVHQLTRVIPPRPVAGTMRMGEVRDVDLLARWIDAFATELDEPLGDGRTIAEQRVALGSIFLWEIDGQPVAMAGFSGATPNGVRINLVYVPPQLRGRGYASNLVAALSQRMLDAGKQFCFLYTDLANPTSNRIYRSLGYEPLSEAIHLTFDAPPPSH